MYERITDQIISRQSFVLRIIKHLFYVLLIMAISIFFGAVGFYVYESKNVEESFLHAIHILSGFGLIEVPETFGGKVFAAFYGLYASLVFLAAFSLIFAPIVHRILHKLHLDDED